VTLRGRLDNEGLVEQILSLVDKVPGVVEIESKLTAPREKGRIQARASV
jgi:hypothetical protein